MRMIRNALAGVFASLSLLLLGQNPIIHNQFTADPTARVFRDKVYLFPSHDIITPTTSKLRKDWFCMADYHVFSSDDLVHWNDHGVIVSQNKVAWVDSTSYSMWAPDCVEHLGKYYFYFPANSLQKDNNGRRGFEIGVAVASKPEGPYQPMLSPISNVNGIDPCVLLDKSGQAYLYWSQGNIYGAKLKENMCELDSQPQVISNLPAKGLKEGPFVFERNGIYYMTYPHVENKIERLEYAMSNQPLGPYHYAGVIMDESPNGCWTNHHSILEFKKQWYLFYHQNDWSPKFDKNRSVRIDSLFFNADGTIRKVIPTLRGVGLSKAFERIDLDRYSSVSPQNTRCAYLDTLHYFDGWGIELQAKNSWLQYNNVDFENKKIKSVFIRYHSPLGTAVDLSQVDVNKSVLLKVPASKNWKTLQLKMNGFSNGVHALKMINLTNNPIEIDWIRFSE